MNGVSYRDFYWNLLEFAENNEDTFIGSELKITLDSLEYAIINQSSLGRVVEEIDENIEKNQLIWDYDEATAIHLNLGNKDRFYRELREFLETNLSLSFDDSIWNDIVKYQSNAIINPYDEYPYVDSFNYNIHDCVLGTTNTLKNSGYQLEFNQSWVDNSKHKKGYCGDKFQFACEKLWWLRNRGEYKARVRKL
jgi:hypothetical protein